MKVFILLLSITSILTFSCNDDKCIKNNVCNMTGSIDEVPWIIELKKTLTNCSCEISLIKGTYNGQVVIFIALTDPLCDGINTPTLYNCEGKVVKSFTSSLTDQKELFNKVTRDSILYRCKN